MTVSDLCEPIFLYVCLLNRLGRLGQDPGGDRTGGELIALFGKARAEAAEDEYLARQYARVEPVLGYFVDDFIRRNRPDVAGGWPGMAVLLGARAATGGGSDGDVGGDEAFFDLLDDTLRAGADRGAAERLPVFHTCLGLGFTGWYSDQPAFLQDRMREVARRIRAGSDAGNASRIVPEAYERLNTDDVSGPLGRRWAGAAVATVGMALVLLAANAYLYRAAVGGIARSVEGVLQSCEAPPASPPVGAPAAGRPESGGAPDAAEGRP